MMYRLAAAITGNPQAAAGVVAGVCQGFASDDPTLPLWHQVLASTRVAAAAAAGNDGPRPIPLRTGDLMTVSSTHSSIQEAFLALEDVDQNLLWTVLLGGANTEATAESLSRALRRLGTALATQSVPELGDGE